MRPRILITDDDEVSCQLFAEVLQGEEYQVNQAHSGAGQASPGRNDFYVVIFCVGLSVAALQRPGGIEIFGAEYKYSGKA